MKPCGHPNTEENTGTITTKTGYSWTFCRECRSINARRNGGKRIKKRVPIQPRIVPTEVRFTRRDYMNIDRAFQRMKRKYAAAAEWKVENVLLGAVDNA